MAILAVCFLDIFHIAADFTTICQENQNDQHLPQSLWLYTDIVLTRRYIKHQVLTI